MSAKNKKNVSIALGAVLLLLVIVGGWFVFKQQSRPEKTPKKIDERIVATTVPMTQIFAKLDVPLVGVPTTNEKLPTKVQKLPQVGNHVSVDMEKIISLKPDQVYVDSELTEDYASKLKEQHIKMTTLNFSDYATMRQTIIKIGKKYGRQKQASQLKKQLQIKKVQRQKKPKVLLLMGMPGGSFLAMNQNSYIGDLVKRAGGQVVAADQKSLMSPVNNEKIAQSDPDVIIRLAHAMPQEVKRSFDESFKSGPYKTLTAVKNKQVYDVQAPKFSPTANLHVKETYQEIKEWLDDSQEN